MSRTQESLVTAGALLVAFIAVWFAWPRLPGDTNASSVPEAGFQTASQTEAWLPVVRDCEFNVASGMWCKVVNLYPESRADGGWVQAFYRPEPGMKPLYLSGFPIERVSCESARGRSPGSTSPRRSSATSSGSSPRSSRSRRTTATSGLTFPIRFAVMTTAQACCAIPLCAAGFFFSMFVGEASCFLSDAATSSAFYGPRRGVRRHDRRF